MVAETLAKRFWQQVMKRKRRNALKGTKCTKRYALLSYYVMGAHFTASTTSGHCLSWKEGREDAWAQCWYYPHRHRFVRGIWLRDTCSLENSIGSVSITSSWGFICCLHVLVCFLTVDPRIKQQLRECVFLQDGLPLSPSHCREARMLQAWKWEQAIKQTKPRFVYVGRNASASHSIFWALNRHFLSLEH